MTLRRAHAQIAGPAQDTVADHAAERVADHAGKEDAGGKHRRRL